MDNDDGYRNELQQGRLEVAVVVFVLEVEVEVEFGQLAELVGNGRLHAVGGGELQFDP